MALISQAEFARQQGFTKGYVTKLIKKGIVKLKHGRVDSVQAEQAMKANADPLTLIRSDQSTDLAPTQPGRSRWLCYCPHNAGGVQGQDGQAGV
ncbi:hypothetical protein [Endozoicomonas sp. 8E]|uniref:hypothetical protein n=1 Tax=Endozoicomonas sp. 8E TaxID=3035692 RepID=UPI0029394736|nr:hypothetical protein [Endozoicomonas sp. 8E]WOG29465.1 hypothetical protein P6910_07395 [Endozoicomonas sp. 8E]